MKKNALLLFLLNVCFVFGLLSNTAHAQVIFSGSHEGINSGNEVCLDVSVTNFEDIIAMQFSMHYDNSLLEFIDFNNLSVLPISVNDFAVFQEDGTINFSWYDPILAGKTLSDNETIFSVCFITIGSESAVSPFSFDGTPVAIEVLDVDENEVDANFNNGSITISGMNTMLAVVGSTINPEWCDDAEGNIFPHVAGGTPPYTYQWSGPDNFTSTEENILHLTSGSYTVSIQDIEGTNVSGTFTVSNNELELDASITPTFCNGNAGKIELEINGISPIFEWSTGSTFSFINGLSAGDYSVTVTEAGCVAEQTFTIEDNGGLATYSTQCDYVDPENIVLTIHALVWCGATPPFTYEWSTGETTTSSAEDPMASSIVIPNPSQSDYTVTITNGLGFEFILDDMQTDCVTPPFTVSGQVTHIDCQNEGNGSIEIQALWGSGSYSYEWNTGETSQNISGLSAGAYSVTVTDLETTATASSNFQVAENLFLLSNIECSPPISADIQVVSWSGILPLTYEWSTGFTETIDIPVSSITVPLLDNNTYSITVTDATGCSETLDIGNVECEDNTEDLHLVISPEQTEIETNESTCIDVVVGNFNEIISLQFTLEWNDALLHFDGVDNFNLPSLSSNNFGNIGNGQLTFSWTDLNLDGETLANNSSIFSVCFTGVAQGNTSLQFSNNPTLIEAYDVNDQEINAVAVSGLVIIGNGGTGGAPTLYASTETSTEGEIVCVDINATNIINMVAMQFSMSWDADALNFIGVENFFFEDIMSAQTTFSPFEQATENGSISIAYIHDDILNGYSFLSDTPLFQLCFEVTASGGSTPISITNTPVTIEFVDENEFLIPITTIAGAVIIEDPLWPGDTDNNGIVNQYDLLNIGLAYGATGTPRALGTDWTAYYAPNWGQSTPNSNIDYKHIDTDGNGQINAEDQFAIELNWGESNDFWDGDTPSYLPPIPENNTTLIAPLYMESDTLILGQSAVLDIILGELDNPADNIYGLAFTISYDADIVVPSSVHAIFDNSWLGTIDENMISIYREDAENGKLHVAVTKTDGIEMSGHGPIGQMEITIKDVIFRDELIPLALSIDDLRLISYSEEEIPVEGISSTTYVDATTGTINPELETKISIYPVPTDDRIFILAKDVNIKKMELLQIDGKHLLDFEDKKVISLKKMNSGNYLLKIITAQGVIVKHIIKN